MFSAAWCFLANSVNSVTPPEVRDRSRLGWEGVVKVHDLSGDMCCSGEQALRLWNATTLHANIPPHVSGSVICLLPMARAELEYDWIVFYLWTNNLQNHRHLWADCLLTSCRCSTTNQRGTFYSIYRTCPGLTPTLWMCAAQSNLHLPWFVAYYRRVHLAIVWSQNWEIGPSGSTAIGCNVPVD